MSPRAGFDDATSERLLALLADRLSARRIAKITGVHPEDVRALRDSTWGRLRLEQIWAERAAQYASKITAARAVLNDALLAAALELSEQLQSPDVTIRHRAAREMLDRAGLPRTTRVEGTEAPPPDLSRLTDDELAEYDRLQAKARGD